MPIGNAITVYDSLKSHGYTSFIVGGFVRDSFLDKTPHDLDMATNADVGEICSIFDKHVVIGENYGTVYLSEFDIEIATFRIDGTGRHPKVDFILTPNGIYEDLKRRDFTINSAAMNPETKEIIDLFGAKVDCKAKIIQTVGDPNIRFAEDPLRMLRAIRFAAQLDFDIAEDTFNAIKSNASLIKTISWERVRVELEKILESNPMKLYTIVESGLGDYLIPEFKALIDVTQPTIYHCYDVSMHTVVSIQNAEPGIMKFIALCHDFGKPEVKSGEHFYGHAEVSARITVDFLDRLKFSNKEKQFVVSVVKNHSRLFGDIGPKGVRRLVAECGEEATKGVIDFRFADIKAQSEHNREARLLQAEEIKSSFETIVNEGQCTSSNTLEISGNDIVALGVSQGPLVGVILSKLLAEVLEDQTKNNKEYLLARAVDSIK